MTSSPTVKTNLNLSESIALILSCYGGAEHCLTDDFLNPFCTILRTYYPADYPTYYLAAIRLHCATALFCTQRPLSNFQRTLPQGGGAFMCFFTTHPSSHIPLNQKLSQPPSPPPPPRPPPPPLPAARPPSPLLVTYSSCRVVRAVTPCIAQAKAPAPKSPKRFPLRRRVSGPGCRSSGQLGAEGGPVWLQECGLQARRRGGGRGMWGG